MNAPDFHAQRLTGIGSSDAAAACGVSRWKTASDVYREKRGESEPIEDNEPMLFGRLLEPVILDEFARRTGLPLKRKPALIRSETHPFMLAHLDALASPDGFPTIVEAKTARSGDGWGEAGTADVPQDYLVQTTHQMVVTGAMLAFIPVLIAGSDFRIYEVPFDRELGGMIVEAERVLWDRIQRGDPPDVDCDAPGALELVRKLFPGTNGQRLRAAPADEHWRAVYHDAVARRDKYATTADGAKAHLLYEMGDAAELEFTDGTVLRRKLIPVKGYTVEPRTQIDARFVKSKD